MNYKLEIIRSQKRRTIAISINRESIVRVRVPKNVSQVKIDEIINQKQSWITEKLEYLKQNTKPQDKDVLYFLGKPLKITKINGFKNSVELSEEEIIVLGDGRYTLQKWLLNKTEEIFAERLKYQFNIFNQSFNFSLPELKIRKMRSRWGSMSHFGVMTLNAKLIHASLDLIDYVIMHELCHLVHQNHGKQFYELQMKFTPNYRELKKELNSF